MVTRKHQKPNIMCLFTLPICPLKDVILGGATKYKSRKALAFVEVASSSSSSSSLLQVLTLCWQLLDHGQASYLGTTLGCSRGKMGYLVEGVSYFKLVEALNQLLWQSSSSLVDWWINASSRYKHAMGLLWVEIFFILYLYTYIY